MKELIGHGAEAKIHKDGEIVTKHRPAKGYRHPEIDVKLRKLRTRKEAKILETLKEIGVPAPELIAVSDKEMLIDMSFIHGPKVRDVLADNINLSLEIGRHVGVLHKHDIVHSDLTTSNMILHEDKVHLIDFGLSFVSKKVEDKAVDLHLLFRALESRHHGIFEECKKLVLKGYQEANPDSDKVLERLAVVETRGRHKK